MKRKMVLAVCAVLSAVMVHAGGRSAASTQTGGTVPVTLTVWTPYWDDGTKAYADYAAQKIKEELPHVTLEFENYPQDGGQTILTRAATGNLPDILSINSGLIASLSRSGNILQLDGYFEKFKWGDNLLPGAFDTVVYSPDGHIYQFATNGVNPHLWFYNKKIFADNGVKVPENYDELLAAVKAFRDKGITPLAMFGKEPWPLGTFFDSFTFRGNPGGFYALSTGKAMASDPGYRGALTKMKALIEAGIFQRGVTNADYDTAAALFFQNQAAMFINGSWFITDVYSRAVSPEDIDFMPYYPTADRGKETVNRQYMAGGGDTDGYGVSAGTKNKDLAAQVAALYTYHRNVKEYTMSQRVELPIKKDSLTTDRPLNLMSKKLLEMLPQYQYQSRYIHNLVNRAFSAGLTEELQKFIVGESVADFTTAIDRLIKSTN
ncbi:ABC transporter substrate-binding protein [Spirochaetia bacterium]|nr:ABC transporter substrate-binding protein [Spirochaetia bacterium]